MIGVKTSAGEFIINPGPDTALDNACKLFVLGNENQLRLLNRLFGLQTPDTPSPGGVTCGLYCGQREPIDS